MDCSERGLRLRPEDIIIARTQIPISERSIPVQLIMTPHSLSGSVRSRADNWMFYRRQGVSQCSGFFLNPNSICVRASVSGSVRVRECLLFSVLYISSGLPEWREISLTPRLLPCHTPHPSLIVFNQQFPQPHASCTLFSLDTGHRQLSMAAWWHCNDF